MMYVLQVWKLMSRFKFKTVAKKLQPKTPYAILDVNEQSTPAQIKKAYIKKGIFT